MSRHRRKKPGARGAARTQQAESAPMADSAWMSNYAGAAFTFDRGLAYWSTNQSRRDIDSFAFSELVSRSRYLHANVGRIRGLVRNTADQVGALTPQPTTTDQKWNREARQYFRDLCGTKAAFDRAGKFNFWTAQPMLTRRAAIDGDVLTVLLATPSGSPRVAFYEGPQIQTPDKTGEGSDWQDGVLLDESGRHLAYGIRNYANDSTAVVSSADAIYFGDFDSPGHVRSIPKLAHAINHAMDIAEFHSFVKKAAKNSALLGVIRELEANAQPSKSKQGLPGTLRKTDIGPDQKGDVLDIWGAGQFPELPPGQKARILHDSRPAAEQMAFVLDLMRDIAVGFGLPLEVVWDMADLTGPAVRFVMDLFARWIEKRQATLEEWCRRVYVWIIAKAIKSGRLSMPSDRRWWSVEFLPERDLTIDRGQVGRLALEELDRGAGTLADYNRRLTGRPWEDQLRQRVEEVKFAHQLCVDAELDYATVFPPRAGAAIAQADPNPPAEPPPDKKAKSKP